MSTVQQFLKVFIDIVLWRQGPQDLPSSNLLVLLTLAAYMAVSTLQLAFLDESAFTWLFFVVVDPLLLAGWVWFVLRVFAHPERFQQTIAAVYGTGALLGLAVYLPAQLLVTGAATEPSSTAAQLIALVMVVIFAAVTGRIIKLATDTGMFTGVAIALTYFLAVDVLISVLRGSVG
ncbi:MAG TPA: hypothetical protein VLM41_07945 [Steroidobacteraceae bacterium]|nr:hypothetical protein [Steroidobacteraceae bacterium]